MYPLLRPYLFHLDPERAHKLTINLLCLTNAFPPAQALLRYMFDAHRHNIAPVEVFGLTFPNCVGLAAGFDKDGVAWSGLSTLGFGHIEVGRKGADFVFNQLSKIPRSLGSTIMGVNIGKNINTPIEEAAQDYCCLLEKFSPVADYLTVNISSPNTIGLRRLQNREMLDDLLNQLANIRKRSSTPQPILVKLAPDLSDAELDDALEAILRNGMDGVIATNTTIAREGLKSAQKTEMGGLSGNPLRARSIEIVQKIYQRTEGKLPIIGVGGISKPEHARAMLDAGASLVQIYTGLIYAGPGLVKKIVQEKIL